MAEKRTDRPITVGGELEIPPVFRDSKYPWEELAEAEPGTKHFFVECEDEEDANSFKNGLKQGGKSYYAKRDISRAVIVRAMEINGNWGVAAWALPIEDEEEDEEE